MTVLKFAINIEKALKKEVGLNCDQWPSELSPIVKLVYSFETELITILEQSATAKATSQNYPELDDTMIPNEVVWRNSFHFKPKEVTDEVLIDLYLNLSMLSNLVEKSVQYLQQAANNSAYQYDKLFFNSISELKLILKRRIDSTARVVYNAMWSKIGFAPFIGTKF
jgi:hypothetical protein